MPFDKRHMAACLEFSKPYRCGWCWDGCSPVSAEDCWSSIKSDCCVLGHLHEQRLSFPVTHFGWTAKMVQTTSQTLRQLLDKLKAWKKMFYNMCPLSQLSAENSLESRDWFKPWHTMWTVETCILMYRGAQQGMSTATTMYLFVCTVCTLFMILTIKELCEDDGMMVSCVSLEWHGNLCWSVKGPQPPFPSGHWIHLKCSRLTPSLDTSRIIKANSPRQRVWSLNQWEILCFIWYVIYWDMNKYKIWFHEQL